MRNQMPVPFFDVLRYPIEVGFEENISIKTTARIRRMKLVIDLLCFISSPLGMWCRSQRPRNQRPAQFEVSPLDSGWRVSRMRARPAVQIQRTIHVYQHCWVLHRINFIVRLACTIFDYSSFFGCVNWRHEHFPTHDELRCPCFAARHSFGKA